MSLRARNAASPQSRLDPVAGARHRGRTQERGKMRAGAGLALACVLLAGGCGSASKCPKPIVYDDATLKEVQAALKALPRDSILRQVMADYENERDDLRFCR